MKKNELDRDIKRFLGNYFLFEIVESPKVGFLALEGKISILDKKGNFWGQFQILILISESDYPFTIPIVIEKSNIIDRNWDFHISEKGECCLDIPHKLLKRKKRGIVFEEFYQDVIYPFFANYHYKKSTKKYANGEYKHHAEGIVQFYEEEYRLKDFEQIIKLLETTLRGIKYEPNKECPICKGRKYKKCCRKVVYDLKNYEIHQLQKDLDLFKFKIKESRFKMA